MTDTSSDACVLPVRIYYEDTDAGGVVYYANYAKYMERGRTEWLRALGIDQSAMAVREKCLFVVASLAIQYRRPARLDDVIAVNSSVRRVGAASIEFAQSITRDGELLCDGTVKVGCVNADSFRPAHIPPELRLLLEKVSS
ncbi:tol-pal system-associated acyl-CoA thioesterase [Paracandidimonas soli]|uniref:Acyl-CoA thioester hydrolase n=1 Tax=Paracandidimonas soli TaxID=1917182 RepID=A0A4R3V607_9BURK|nr:tol-pal system-associated acyl-CoA thioesterase [Paracandidimonas soli]TCU99001.1 acyl-CoA thioester hydrolase [Paracandidimonas soli]